MRLRWIETLFAAGLVLALIGGALLWSHLQGVAEKAALTAGETAAIGDENAVLAKKNRRLIALQRGLDCDLGRLVLVAPVANPRRQSGESRRAAKHRVRVARAYIRGLRRIDCRNLGFTAGTGDEQPGKRERDKGGGRQQGNPPSQPSAPGNGGSGGKIVGKPPTRPTPPPGSPDPILDPICELTNPLLPIAGVCR